MLSSVPLQITSQAGKNRGNGGLYVLRDISESHSHPDVLKEAQRVSAGKTHITTIGLLQCLEDVSYRVPGGIFPWKPPCNSKRALFSVHMHKRQWVLSEVRTLWFYRRTILTRQCTHTHQVPPEQDRDPLLPRSLTQYCAHWWAHLFLVGTAPSYTLVLAPSLTESWHPTSPEAWMPVFTCHPYHDDQYLSSFL